MISSSWRLHEDSKIVRTLVACFGMTEVEDVENSSSRSTTCERVSWSGSTAAKEVKSCSPTTRSAVANTADTSSGHGWCVTYLVCQGGTISPRWMRYSYFLAMAECRA